MYKSNMKLKIDNAECRIDNVIASETQTLGTPYPRYHYKN